MVTKRKVEKVASKELKYYGKIISCLIDLYCYNPNEAITIEKVEKYLKIKECNVLQPFLLELREKGILKRHFGKYYITFNGFQSLLEMKEKRKKSYIDASTFAIAFMLFMVSSLTCLFEITIYKLLINTISFILYCLAMFFIIKNSNKF